MLNLTLKVAGFLLLVNFALSDVEQSQKTQRVESPPADAVKTEVREYRAKNGHSLAITSLGSFVRYEGPKMAGADGAPIRDGYTLTYKHPRDGKQVVAAAGAGAGGEAASVSGDLVPVSFEAPATGAVLSGDETLTAKVTVRTRDGLLRLTHLITWEPGKNSLSVRTDIANSDAGQAVPAVVFARTIDATVEDLQDAVRTRLKLDGKRNILLAIRCTDCPPPPPTDPGPVPVGPGDPIASITNGATRASLTWNLSLSKQPSAPATTQYALRDAPRP